MSELSPLLADWVQELGIENTEKILNAYRGETLYVPMRYPSEAMIERLGRDLAITLVAEYRGCTWRVPLGAALDRYKRDTLVRLRRDQGMSLSKIAQEFELSYSGVRDILRRPPLDLGSDLSLQPV